MSEKEESLVTSEGKVFDSCNETHVFPNAGGQITILQKCWPEDDILIIIPKEHIEKVVSALRLAKRELQCTEDI